MDWDHLEQEAYGYLGLTPHEFYEYTPNEYNNMLQGYQTQRELKLRDIQAQAWFNANFVGKALSGSELPSLEEILTMKKTEIEQVKDDYMFISLAIKMGLKVPQELRDQILKG